MTDMPTLIQQSRDALTQVQDKTTLIQQNIGSASQDLLDATIATRDWLQTLVDRLEDLLAKLDEYIAALVDPENSDQQEWEYVLNLFEISLTDAQVGASEGWQKGDGERVKEVYQAVYDIIQMLEQRMFSGDTGLAILQFIDTFGGTELRIIPGANPDDPDTYAITNPDGSYMSLYNAPDPLLAVDISRGYPLHRAVNLVHEFGHVLSFSLGNTMRNSWDTNFRILVVEATVNYFETNLGWRTQFFALLQNQSTYGADVLSGNMTTTELEEERLANMFQGLVYQYELRTDVADCDELHPDPNNPDPNCIERRAAWVMRSFMTGDCPPSDVFTDPGQQPPPCNGQERTLLDWIRELGEGG